MAEKKQSAKKRTLKKTESVRQRAAKAAEPKKARRIHRAGSVAARPFKAARNLGKKEFHPVKLPDNKVGRFLTKRRSLTPRYFKEAWQELRQVTWPNRRDTVKLTLAVFVFAIFFGLLITAVDFGLDRLFKDLILK